MGRRSSSYGGSRSYSTGWPSFRSKSSLGKKSYPTLDKDKKSPPPAKVETTTFDGRRRFFSSITDGFGWGYGNALGHRIGEAIFGPRTIKFENVTSEKVESEAVTNKDDNDKFKDYTETCSISYNAFQDCLYERGNDLSKCHIFMESLFECKRNSSSLITF